MPNIGELQEVPLLIFAENIPFLEETIIKVLSSEMGVPPVLKPEYWALENMEAELAELEAKEFELLK